MTKLRCEKRALRTAEKKDIAKMLEKLIKKIELAKGYAVECVNIFESAGEDVNGLGELRSAVLFVELNLEALFSHVKKQRERPAFK